jgi:tRNA(Ile)-lysidine synthase
MVAVSGGPDSVALLLAAVDAAPARGIRVYACWVDHGIRPEDEIALERVFVEGLCADLGVELAVEAAGRGTLQSAAHKDGGIEAAARRFRYESLERARLGFGCDAILTGHTADDCIETMVMRFCTGSGTAGLRGIPARNGAIFRPLLGVGKADVLHYLEYRGQAYRTDSTNLGVDYLRNRVRRDVLPSLLSVFPSLGASLGTVAGKLALDEEALAAAAAALLADSRGIDAGLFDRAPVAVRTRALHLIAAHLGTGRLSGSLVLAAARSAAHSGTLSAGSGIEFARENGLIVARARTGYPSTYSGPEASGYSLVARVPGAYRIGTDMVITIYSTGKADGPRGVSCAWPVCIRSRRPGDSITLRCGHKMVDALLSEYGIRRSVRDILPVVEDCLGVAAVLCSCAGGRDVFRDDDVPGESRDHSGVSMDYCVFDVKGAVLTDAS